MSATEIDIAQILAPHRDRIETRLIRIGSGLIEATDALLSELLPPPPWLLCADGNTWKAAGEKMAAGLAARKIPYAKSLFETSEQPLVASDAEVESLTSRLAASGANALVAIGSGTINDVAKLASLRSTRPYAVIATAPSMNGYTSAAAALLSAGVKVTTPARAPVACLFDLDVVAAAPQRMIAAGFGDLLSRAVSMADWRLSHRLLQTPYDQESADLMTAAADLVEEIEAGLRVRDHAAVARLCAALSVSGAAMALAGSSAPASGGEHLISHYLDMTAIARGLRHDLHGCQVGVATLVTAGMYERLLQLAPGDIDVTTATAHHPTWEEYALLVEGHFGPMSDDLLDLTRPTYPETADLPERLLHFRNQLPGLRRELAHSLYPAAHLRRRLRDAGAPTSFAEVGVDPAWARDAILHCKDIRPRYTILHLAHELGRLQLWGAELLANQRI